MTLALLQSWYHQTVIFLSSPRTAGRGGGLASVFKKKFDCRSIKTDTFSSFEVQLMQTVYLQVSYYEF